MEVCACVRSDKILTLRNYSGRSIELVVLIGSSSARPNYRTSNTSRRKNVLKLGCVQNTKLIIIDRWVGGGGGGVRVGSLALALAFRVFFFDIVVCASSRQARANENNRRQPRPIFAHVNTHQHTRSHFESRRHNGSTTPHHR